MSKIWIIGAKKSYESIRLQDEFEKRDIEVEQYNWDELVMPLKRVPDVCIIRYSKGMMEKLSIVYLLSVIEELERKKVLLVPELAGIYREDKMSMYLLWRENLIDSIKMPETIITKNIDIALDFLRKKGILIFKPIVGGLGKNVMLIRKKQELIEIYKEFQVLYLQEYIESKGYDIRVIIINNKIVSSYIRYNPKDFRHNIHVGGKGITIEEMMDKDKNLVNYMEVIKNISIKIANVAKLSLIGIDYLPSKDGELYLLEWNSTFGFAGAESATGINIAKKIAEHIISKIRNY